MPDQYTPISFNDFVRNLTNHSILSDAYFIAKHNERYIGLSYLKRKKANPEQMEQQLTGVVRVYRRQGIATALKVRGIEYAAQQGYRTIISGCQSNNEAMLALNEKLGFRRHMTWVTLERSMGGERWNNHLQK